MVAVSSGTVWKAAAKYFAAPTVRGKAVRASCATEVRGRGVESLHCLLRDFRDADEGEALGQIRTREMRKLRDSLGLIPIT